MTISPGPSPPPPQWLALIGVCFGVTMYTLDGSIVNIAVPTLLKVFNTNFVTIQWTIIGYLLVIVCGLLAIANLANQIGQKRIFTGGLALFTLGSLLCGLALNIQGLIVFRLIQGAGAVCMAALMASIVVRAFPKAQLGQALGIVTTAATIGTSFGPSLGGFLIGAFGWRSIFLVNIPIGIVAIALVIKALPDDELEMKGPLNFDWSGFLLMTISFVSLLMLILNGSQGKMNANILMLLGAISLLSFCSFIYVENQLKYPLIDLKIFNNSVLNIGLLGRFLTMTVNGSYLFMAPFLLENALNYSTSKSGLFLTTTPIIVGLTAPWFGKLSDRYGAGYFNVAGLILMGLGLLTMSTLSINTTEMGFIARVSLWGLGIGVFNAPNTSISMKSVGVAQSSTASALMSLAIMFGQAIGVSVLGSLFRFFSFQQSAPSQALEIIQLPPTAIAAGMSQTVLWGIIPMVLLIILNLLGLSSGLHQQKKGSA